MAHTLPPLPYAKDALEPYIDALTVEIHHDRHHNTYVTNLNNAIAGTEYESWSLEDLVTKVDSLPDSIKTAVRNNGGGHINHTLYWETLGPAGGSGPSGALAEAIDEFGGLDALKDAVGKAGAGRFGSGWAWVVVKDGKLAVTSTPNQDSPLMDGSGTPILGVDVWEHAYYLKYQNKRPDYLAAIWNVVNWEKVAEYYAAATS